MIYEENTRKIEGLTVNGGCTAVASRYARDIEKKELNGETRRNSRITAAKRGREVSAY